MLHLYFVICVVPWEIGAWSQWTDCFENMQRREKVITKVGNLKELRTQETRDCDSGKEKPK